MRWPIEEFLSTNECSPISVFYCSLFTFYRSIVCSRFIRFSRNNDKQSIIVIGYDEDHTLKGQLLRIPGQ